MLVVNIEQSLIKVFMTKLFKGSMFDDFEMKQCYIDGMVKVEIDGRVGKEYIEENGRGFIEWSKIKENTFAFIKGRKTPKTMKLIFQFPEHRLSEIGDNIASASVNVIFEGGSLTCTAGISQKNFSMDRQCESVWEDRTKKFFLNNGFGG